MSIPFALGAQLTTLADWAPYLKADPASCAVWRQKMGGLPKRRWAIAWSSGISNAKRDVPLSSLLAALAKIPEINQGSVQLLGLQTRVHDSDADALTSFRHLHWLGDEIRDFADTAAILDGCERVISVDTALIHLAGSMGIDADLLLPFVPDWRWCASHQAHRWYPSICLHRQEAEGEWDVPLHQLAMRLSALFRQNRATGSDIPSTFYPATD